MIKIETEIFINAKPQTVWSVLDSLPTYPDWNPVVPELAGRTMVDCALKGVLLIPDLPTPPLTPTVTRVVGAREFRWLSNIPGDEGFSAEHIFILEPKDGGTLLKHQEIFDGPAAPFLAEPAEKLVKPAYQNFNRVFKERIEKFSTAKVVLHPATEKPSNAISHVPSGETVLRCACKSNPVEITLNHPVQHNHLCGCSKCWRPEGAIFAQIAVVPKGSAKCTAHEEKLVLRDPNTSIQRHACAACGVHMVGRVINTQHHFYGLDFVHPELNIANESLPIEFAGFVSSVIETGTSASLMEAIRNQLDARGIPAYDAFSPEIMDIIAYHQVKLGFDNVIL